MVFLVVGFGFVCKDYEENVMVVEKNWMGKWILIVNVIIFEVIKGRSVSDMMIGMEKVVYVNYYFLFKIFDINYCGGMVWINYYFGFDDVVLIYKKG